MKHFFKPLFLFILLSSALSQDIVHKSKVLVRKNSYSMSLHEELLELRGLTSKESYKNNFFQIIESNSTMPVRLDNEELSLKASTVYYYAYKTFEFWNQNQPDVVEKLGLVTIRINVDSESNANRAIINESGKEIWLGMMKPTSITEMNGFEIPTLFADYASQFGDSSNLFFASNMKQSTLEHILYPDYASASLLNTYLINTGLMIISNLVLSNVKHYDRLIQGKSYFQDPAFVAETIMGSVTKLMFSKKLNNGLPMINGIADFYTTLILDSKRINGTIDKYFYGNLKRRVNKKRYKIKYEYDPYNQQDFVLSLLWKVKLKFPELSKDLIFHAQKYFTKDMTINKSLLRSLLYSCDEICPNPFEGKIKLHKIFHKKGF